MKRNTKIIISITGIIIITLMLLGLTYGYFVTKINGNTNSKSIEITSGTMQIEFTDLSEEISALIEPGYETVKVFTIENTGNVPATYSIYLVDVINSFNRTEDIVYTLYRTDGTVTDTITKDTDFSGWTEVKTGTYPTSSSAIKSDEVIPLSDNGTNKIYTYTLKITYINQPTIDQSEDQGKTFSGKINIRPSNADTNPFSEGTLAYSIIDNGAEVPDEVGDVVFAEPGCAAVNGEEWCIENGATVTSLGAKSTKINTSILTKESFTGISDIYDNTDNGLFIAEDDYGNSYYYRGYIKNNYVSFAGFTWRIVRINGDGSIRLILEGTLDKVTKDGTAIYKNEKLLALNSNGLVPFITLSGDNAYVGYMYGDFGTNSTSYDDAHENIKDSTIKTYIDTFYEEYLLEYEVYLADALFCADKTRASGYTTLGYGYNETYYSTIDRLYNSDNEVTPTLRCASKDKDVDSTLTEQQRSYSRYTSKLNTSTTTSKGVLINNDLTYPIALLSADELVLAGAFKDTENKSYYLYDAYAENLSHTSWWTISPYELYPLYQKYFINNANKSLDYDTNGANKYSTIGTRPVINLKAGILLDSGDGTSGSPYVVKLG